MIIAIPQIVREDATSLIQFTGAPNMTISWSLAGAGTVIPINSTMTDSSGLALAIFTPGALGTAIISVTHANA
jgi:hypothetical protein